MGSKAGTQAADHSDIHSQEMRRPNALGLPSILHSLGTASEMALPTNRLGPSTSSGDERDAPLKQARRPSWKLKLSTKRIFRSEKVRIMSLTEASSKGSHA